VINDPVDVIASGPSAPDSSTFAQALKILDKYGLIASTPFNVNNRLQCGIHGDIPETPKPNDSIFKYVQNVIIGSNTLAAEAALEQARKEGFQSTLLSKPLQGEASQVGRKFSAIASECVASGKPIARPACIIAGGETTVTVQGNGLGGRNQELALGAVDELDGLENTALIALATDGGDGPTDAAGAVVTGDTKTRASKQGLSPEDYLLRNDAYHFFEALGDLLKPGPTQTNVNDLAMIFTH
jgi:glycerate 2-kinase